VVPVAPEGWQVVLVVMVGPVEMQSATVRADAVVRGAGAVLRRPAVMAAPVVPVGLAPATVVPAVTAATAVTGPASTLPEQRSAY
jgi:hypothetical protein